MSPAGTVRLWDGRHWPGTRRIDLAKPVRPLTPAQHTALDKALAARRTCRACGKDAGFYLPRSSGRRCWPCHQNGPTNPTDAAGQPVAA